MNTKNLEYLKEGLQYTGFGGRLNEALEANVRQQQPSFQLKTEIAYFSGSVDYTLHFRKSDQSDMYFFNKYDATLKSGQPEQERSQTFYINQNSGITAREAYNLLSGRAVQKELVNAVGQPYQAWLQLDPEAKDASGSLKLRQFHENYGFDLEKALQPYAIREFHDPQLKDQLLRSLQKGNVQQVTALLDGRETKRFIEASPQYKTINVYDEKLKPVKRETLLRPELQQETTRRQPQQQKKVKQDAPPEDQPERKQSRRRGISM